MRALLPILALFPLAFALAPASRTPSPVAGRVIDERDQPVCDAVVRYKGTTTATLTKGDGRFSLPPPRRRFTAWKEGYFIAGGRSPLLRLERLPDEDDPKYSWIDPTPDSADERRCGNCHGQIHAEWQRGGHARAAVGRPFSDLYSDLLREHPNGSGVCASCHAPTVKDDDPALFDLRLVGGVDRLGVHCDYCHKVAGPGEGELGLAHGRFYHRLLRPAKGQMFFGPLDDVDRGEDSYSPFYRDSRYCAACHEGTVFGVHAYTTYSEWQASPASRQGMHCQHCHMKPTGKMKNIAPGRGGIDRDPKTLANHHFWDESHESMLRRCLRLEVTTQRLREGVAVSVTLTARGVGHRVPTGFIDRQLILVVEALDAKGQRVRTLSGPTLPAVAGRELEGLSGRLYARRGSNEEGESPVPFWRALPELEDTRLHPEVPDDLRFVVAGEAERIRVRVLHRRFWAKTAEAKRWPLRDLEVMERTREVK